MNIVNLIDEFQKKIPFKKAVVIKVSQNKFNENIYSHLTFRELWEKSSILANNLVDLKVKKGDKVLLFVKPSLDFAVLTLSLFKMGVIPVLIDPGMGRKNLLTAIKHVRPEILITENKGILFRYLFASSFKSVKILFSKNKISKLIRTENKRGDDFTTVSLNPEDTAAILFTSGGTGAPKGVVYTHKIFIKQVELLQKMFNLTENDIDFPGFPFFYLFSLSMGMTVVFPDMDPTKPAKCDPQKLIKEINDFGVTFAAGSPAIWRRVALYATEKHITLPSIKILAMFGAPVPMTLHKMYSSIIPEGETFTPYGATEALPLTNMGGKNILSEGFNSYNEGKGLLVGTSVNGVEIKIIESVHKMIPDMKEAKILKPREIGEIIVSGENVTTEYFDKSIATAMSKIHEPDQGKIWHRMGDVGFLDEHNRLWFMGRKDHVVKEKLYPLSVEPIFDRHPKVRKSVLIGTKNPSIVIERIDGKTNLTFEEKESFEKELLDLARPFESLKGINKFFYEHSLPVDIRHNIKIDRIKLKDKFEGTT